MSVLSDFLSFIHSKMDNAHLVYYTENQIVFQLNKRGIVHTYTYICIHMPFNYYIYSN